MALPNAHGVLLFCLLSSLSAASTSAFVVSPSSPWLTSSSTVDRTRGRRPSRIHHRIPPTTSPTTGTRLAAAKEDGATPKKRASKKTTKRATKAAKAPAKAERKGPVADSEMMRVTIEPKTATKTTRVVNPGTDYFLGALTKARSDLDTTVLGDLTGGRPGAVIETEEQLDRKQEIFDELARGERKYDAKIMADYGELEEEALAEYDTDDPTALDASTLGTWTIRDLQSKFDYEWNPDPGSDDPDPNMLELQHSGVRYKVGVDIDPETGIEIGYDPIFGPSSPQDERTILGTMDSYMIDSRTKDDELLTPQFLPGDLEIDYNQKVVDFRKSLDILETYTDEFLPPDIEIPRHVAKWHGYPEPMAYPTKDESINQFTQPQDKTDFSKLTPFEARQKAVELARAQNAEWLPYGKSQAWHASQREPYEKVGTLVGTLRKGRCDETLVARIQPALEVLKSSVDLLSIEGEEQTVFRFHYHGLMKNKHGMAAWTETLIRDCGVPVTGVVFETGFRKRDMAYDGGDCWYPPSS